MSIRVALDTNILLSGIIWPRWPYAILQHALAGEVVLVLPEIVILEARRQIERNFPDAQEQFERFLALVEFEITPIPTAEEVTKRIRLGAAVEGRDEKGIKKTVAAFLKMLHPDGPPSDADFEEYVAYAVESRRRIKEQMNKRKPDDEFARIDLSYFAADGRKVIVYCPESKDAPATQQPKKTLMCGCRTRFRTSSASAR